MISFSCAITWLLALFLLPLLILLWAMESPGDRAKRWRQQGMTQTAIASRLGVSRYRVRQLLAT